MSLVFINGVKVNTPSEKLSNSIKDVFLKASNNLSWLSPGDIVLLKPALNSPDPYPSTTHPLSLHAIAELLEEKGAKVVVGDQSGIKYVLHTKSGVIRGSSKELFEKSGMSKSNLEFIAFEEDGWEKGFYNYPSTKASSWPKGFYITKWVKKADHIINLPRLSTHSQAGVTLGFKNMVGLLREDSRVNFHANGPFYPFIKRRTKGKLGPTDDMVDSFFKKITEISLALQDKLRVTLFTATKAQVTFGPDKYVISIGSKGLGYAYNVTPNTGLVFASSDPVAAEVFALSFLTILYSKAPVHQKLLQKLLIFFNGKAKELGKQSIWENPFVRHALNLSLGSDSIKMKYKNTPRVLQTKLNNLIKKRS